MPIQFPRVGRNFRVLQGQLLDERTRGLLRTLAPTSVGLKLKNIFKSEV